MRNLFLTSAFIGTLASATASADDRLNIRTNPFMVLGQVFVNLELDIKTGEHWVVGPFAQARTDTPEFDAGIRATYFEQGAFQPGWFTGIELQYSELESSERAYLPNTDEFCRYEEDGSETCGLGPTVEWAAKVDHGYFWRWGTFNSQLGIGATYSVNSQNEREPSLLPNVFFSIGWVR